MPYTSAITTTDRTSFLDYTKWDGRLRRIYMQKGKGVLASHFARFNKKEHTTPLYEWYEQRPYSTRHTTINNGGQVAINATTFTVTDATIFQEGMIIHHPVTRQNMLVTEINGSILTVVRQATLNASLSNTAMDDATVIGVLNVSLAEGQAQTDSYLRDPSQRTTRIGTSQRQVQLTEDDLLYATKLEQPKLQMKRREDMEEEMAVDADESFLFSVPFTNGTGLNKRMQTEGFVQALLTNAAGNSYTLTNANWIGSGTSTSVVDAMSDLYNKEESSGKKIGICGPGFFDKIQHVVYEHIPQAQLNLSQKDDYRGIEVTRLTASGFQLDLYRANFLNRLLDGHYNNRCFVIDPDSVTIVHPPGYASMKRRKLPLINNRLPEGEELVWKWGLALEHPIRHGMIQLTSVA